MKINKNIRVKVIKRILKRLNNYYKSLSPYGYVDTFEVYKEIDYWEEKLEQYNKNYE